MPVSLSHNFVYGSSLRVTYASQVLTGLILTLHYVGSFDGLIDYGRDVEGGTFIRYMHANGASLFSSLCLLTWHVDYFITLPTRRHYGDLVSSYFYCLWV